MKDNFSKQAEAYALFRPSYPEALAAKIAQLSPGRSLVWDCATGNGQMAVLLANYFDSVIATDASARQLEQAIPKPNIIYRLEQAHQSSLEDCTADAVVIAQAIHWFNFDDFYREVHRVVRPGGLIVVVGYPLMDVGNEALAKQLAHFYTGILGDYWDPERKYLDENYKTIPFPFDAAPIDSLTMHFDWSLATFSGYLETWSALQHYRKKTKTDPLPAMRERLLANWPESETVPVIFTILVRAGIVGSAQ